MPKPLLLRRPSGLYVRFLVPADLRPQVGSRFLIRPLHLPPGDAARLAAARLGMALSEAFGGMRAGAVVDVAKLIADAQAGRLSPQEFRVDEVKFRDGTVLRGVVLDNAKDRADLKEMAAEHGGFAKDDDQEEEAPGRPIYLAIVAHLDDLRRAKRAAKTILDSEHALRIFQGVVGDEKPVNMITDDDCRAYLDAVEFWPKNASRRPEFEGLTVLEIVAAGKSERALAEAEGREFYSPAPATHRKHRQRLSAFFNSLRKGGHIARNPLHGIPTPAKDDDEGGRAYTQEELNAIFDPSTYGKWVSGLPHRFWGPLLALYSGARRNEIGQLYLADITEEGPDGDKFWGFHVNNRFPGQKIKNPDATRRFVPIAKPLLDAGFLKYVEDVKATKHSRLFPHMPNIDGSGFGKQLGRQYIAYLNSLGQKEEGMGLHYFRNTLSTRLNRAGVDDGTIDAITGHKNAKTVLRKHYIDPPTLSERVAALAKFDPGVAIPSYKKGQFDEALKAAHDLPAKWERARKKRIRKKAKADAKKASRARA